MKGLLRKTVGGLAWNTVVDVGQLIFQIAVTAVLARLLTKADFGLVAMALVAVRFVQALTQLGLGTAAIQSASLTEAQFSALFCCNVAIYASVALACTFGAPLGAAFFNEPGLTSILRVLGWSVFLNSFLFRQVLEVKALRFRAISLIRLASNAVSGSLAVVLALQGWGAWALVARVLSQKVFEVAGTYLVLPGRLVRPRFEGVGRLFGFGAKVLGANIATYFSQNAAPILIGRLAGAEALGVFTIAYNLAIVPANRMKTIFSSVLTSSFSQIQERTGQLADRYYQALFALTLVYIPAMLGLSAAAPEVTAALYGAGWVEAGPVLRVTALAGLLKGVEHLTKTVLIARGEVNSVLWNAIAEFLTITALVAVLATRFGAIGAAFACLGGGAVTFTLTALVAGRAIGRPKVLADATGRSFLAGCASYLLVYTLGSVAPAPPPLGLLWALGVGGLSYGLIRYGLLRSEEKKWLRLSLGRWAPGPG